MATNFDTENYISIKYEHDDSYTRKYKKLPVKQKYMAISTPAMYYTNISNIKQNYKRWLKSASHNNNLKRRFS